MPKTIVYLLTSNADPNRHYVGLTGDLPSRLDWHNSSRTGHTRMYKPWSVSVSIVFPDEARAKRFERYLKSGSGRAFAKRHFEVRLTG
jgi:predicted GIY-YIG superfamily endonuclease